MTSSAVRLDPNIDVKFYELERGLVSSIWNGYPGYSLSFKLCKFIYRAKEVVVLMDVRVIVVVWFKR